jgi:signal transduction histidine kinase
LANVSAAIVLSVGIFVLVHVHLDPTDPHGSVPAGIAAVAMTLPVLWARRWPLAAAATVAAASLANWLLVGHYIRCGAALPAAFWIACVLGLRVRDRLWMVGLALLLIDVLAQCFGDPQLDPPTILAAGPITIGFWFAGRTIRTRADAVRRVAEKNAEIVATREKTVRLAVELERDRIATGLNAVIQERISGMGSAAAAAREHIAGPDAADRFAAIAADGRQALADMREVVGSLRSASPLGPQPDLSQLADLVRHNGGRLRIEGTGRKLPASVEVSGYRIVELLLRAAAADTANPVDVELRFAAELLEIRVISGLPGDLPEAGPELAVVRHRVSVHGGSLVTAALADRLHWVARLPLTADNA